MDFTIDAGIVIGLVLLPISTFYYLSGPPASYHASNFWVSFIASVLTMMISLVGLNCMVKGLAGPTSAIFQANIIISVALNAIVLGLLPNI
jgi:hypothetical protein